MTHYCRNCFQLIKDYSKAIDVGLFRNEELNKKGYKEYYCSERCKYSDKAFWDDIKIHMELAKQQNV